MLVEDCDTELDVDEVIPEVSLHVIEGTNHPQTILVDSDNTRNSVNPNLDKQCGLIVTKEEPLIVMVEN